MISIIIPTFNEAANITRLLQFLQQNRLSLVNEIIVSDGGSKDQTIALAKKMGAITVLSPQKSRAAQMNYGATFATGSILYFIHADTLPPKSFVEDITAAVKNKVDCGRYKTKFDSTKWLLKLNAWFTRFDWFLCYGGDQTFFITKKLFAEIKGYNEEMIIMEEYDLTARAKQQGQYKILAGKTLISARKYEGRTWLQVQRANAAAIRLYKKGAPQQTIANTYNKMLGI